MVECYVKECVDVTVVVVVVEVGVCSGVEAECSAVSVWANLSA